MNNQIQEIANQVERIRDLYNIGPVHRDAVEQFAELIVQECMTTMLKESKWYWDKDEFESSNAIQNATRRVKERFGVEK